jgi:hypothetical protein
MRVNYATNEITNYATYASSWLTGQLTNVINSIGVEAIYFDAVKPSDLTTEDYTTLSHVNNPKSYMFQKYTRLPILISFIMCFMDALVNNYSTIILFEDDIMVKVDKNTLINSIKEFNESDMDVFYMGYCFLNCSQPVNNFDYLVKITDNNLICCHSMCFKTHFLQELIDYSFPMTYNADELFRNFYQLQKLNVCVPRSVYFTQNRTSVDSLNESRDNPELFKTCNF